MTGLLISTSAMYRATAECEAFLSMEVRFLYDFFLSTFPSKENLKKMKRKRVFGIRCLTLS